MNPLKKLKNQLSRVGIALSKRTWKKCELRHTFLILTVGIKWRLCGEWRWWGDKAKGSMLKTSIKSGDDVLHGWGGCQSLFFAMEKKLLNFI